MKDTIHTTITSTLTSLQLEGGSFAVEHPADITHGDYASNVAMAIAKKNQRAPLEIANAVARALEGVLPGVERITVVAPGFVNFYLTREYLTTTLTTAVNQGVDWGKNTTWSGKRVLVEYTDPNPFKEFHIGHLFTNAVGESIARLFIMNGADTKRLCYQGDVGMHVAHALWGMQKLGLTPESTLTAHDMGRAYALGATAYKDNEEVKAETKALNKKIYERTDSTINALYDAGKTVSLTYFESIYHLVGTPFDAYFFESDAGPHGKNLVLNHPEVFQESDGAYIFPGEEYGLHTRVFLNNEGLPTYEAKELALAKLKEEHFGHYDLSVISTAKEITEYFKVLLKAMSFVYPNLAQKTEHLGHGMVRLATGKMSSRTGDIIPALTLINEVADAVQDKMRENTDNAENRDLAVTIAIGAIKYATLKGSIVQDSVFDKDRALSFEGDSGPYLQYTHARICSVLKRAHQTGVTPSAVVVPEAPYHIERMLYRFPEVVDEALTERAPHLLTTYLTELAGDFNTFYQNEKIADADDPYAPYKALICESVRHTLKNGLWTLGIEAPEAM